MKIWMIIAGSALCGLLSSCTAFKGFELDQPTSEVTLDGPLYSTEEGGYTVYYGKVRNTGDVDVEEVSFVIDVYGTDDAFLGRFSGVVAKDFENLDTVRTLDAGDKGPGSGETGDFIVTTTVPWGQAVRTESHAEFTEVIPVDTTP